LKTKRQQKNQDEIRKIGDQPLRDVLRNLGGWPVIEPNWKPPNISIEKLMGRLRGEYSEPVLIELYVGADDKNSSINILQVSLYTTTKISKYL
jgi:neprilysin